MDLLGGFCGARERLWDKRACAAQPDGAERADDVPTSKFPSPAVDDPTANVRIILLPALLKRGGHHDLDYPSWLRVVSSLALQHCYTWCFDDRVRC
jgi:hypothetical protein